MSESNKPFVRACILAQLDWEARSSGVEPDRGYIVNRADELIASIEREAAVAALREAADGIESRRNEPGLVHLDVRYAGYYAGLRSGLESDTKALRARAAEIREGKSDGES